MADQLLNASLPLGGYDELIGSTRLCEITTLDIVSIATPRDGHDTLTALTTEKLGLALPDAGKISRQDESSSLLGLQLDQCFMITQQHALDPAAALKTLLGNSAYISDQSDSWVVVDISGPDVIAALERICPLDLAPDVFDDTVVARTVMEHLSVIMERPEQYRFRLYSPRSSAASFLHALSVSIRNVSLEDS